MSEVIAITILVMAFCGILLAAAYSVFGKPRTVTGKERQRQVKSGFRLAGWVLFTFAFVSLLLGSLASLVGKGYYTQPIHRVVAVILLVIQSVLMFRWVNHWLNWFIGFLGYGAVKMALSALLGYSISVPRLVASRTVFLGGLLCVASAIAACWPYLNRRPAKTERVALVLLAISFCLWMVLDSVVPAITGIASVFSVQLAHRIWRGPKRHYVKRVFS